MHRVLMKELYGILIRAIECDHESNFFVRFAQVTDELQLSPSLYN